MGQFLYSKSDLCFTFIISAEHRISEECTRGERLLSSMVDFYIVSIVPADVLAPLGARTSAGIVMANWGMTLLPEAGISGRDK